MSQASNEAESTFKQFQGCKKPVFIFGTVVFICFFIFSANLIHSANNDQINILIGIVGIIVSGVGALLTLFQWLIPPQVVPQKLRPFLLIFSEVALNKTIMPNKKDYFISYHPADRRLAKKKVIRHLEWAGYSTIPCGWGNTDYLQEMRSADSKANFTLTILSTHYLNKLRRKHEWVQAFKDRNNIHIDSKHIVIFVREQELEDDLASINKIDLIGLDKAGSRDTLLARIPSHSQHAEPAFGKSQIWNVPYPHFKFFTGREDILEDIFSKFRSDEMANSMHPQAIKGLSGMGKTQTAVEYAHRYASRYKAVIWIDASGNKSLNSICQEIDSLLKSYTNAQIHDSQQVEEPKSVSQPLNAHVTGKLEDPKALIDAIREELKKHESWLLILDKCEDLSLTQHFTSYGWKGDILITTRLQDTADFAHPVELRGLNEDEGALFLLRRIEKIGLKDNLRKASVTDQQEAKKISKALEGLPLGLAHAGAYINKGQDKSSSSLSSYLAQYEKQFAELFKEEPDFNFSGSPLDFSEEGFKTIATTWTLSFEKLKNESPMAAELLLFCALLSTEAIPEEMITNTPDLDKTLLEPISQQHSPAAYQTALNDAIGKLGKYSLIERSNNTLRVHRVVQAVIREGMIFKDGKVGHTTIRKVADSAVKAVNHALKEINHALPYVEFAKRKLYEDHLPHALTCVRHIQKKEWKIKSLEAMRLLYITGHYLLECARYTEAEPLLKKAVDLHKDISDEKFPSKARLLSTLAELYSIQGNYPEAKKYYEEALKIPGISNADRASVLNGRGGLYDDLDEQDEAEQAYKEAKEILRQQLPKHLDDAHLISHLLVIVSNLSWCYYKQEKHREMKSLYNETLETFKELLGDQHAHFQLSATLKTPDIYERMYELILEVLKNFLEPDHPFMAQIHANVATLYTQQGKYPKAIELYKGILSIQQQSLEENTPRTANRHNNLAELYRLQGRSKQAEIHYKKALDIFDALKLETPQRAAIMKNYAAFLKATNTHESNKDTLKDLERRARAIVARHEEGRQNLLQPQLTDVGPSSKSQGITTLTE